MPIDGLHHGSKLNAYNLADDLIEPLRPSVDYKVANEIGRDTPDEKDTLTTEHKQSLIALLLHECQLDGNIMNLMNSSEQMAVSLVKCSLKKSPDYLSIPTWPDESQ